MKKNNLLDLSEHVGDLIGWGDKKRKGENRKK